MRLADPVHNVELRRNAHGHDSVVFAFPYRADIVDAVRSIPGRRFDWQAKEWWAPRADATAPYVQGVLERFPELEVAPEVDGVAGAARSRAGSGASAPPGATARGWFVLDAIAGELPEELASPRSAAAGCGCRSPRRWPTGCSSWPAPGWTRARCAAPPGCRSAWSPRRPRCRWSRATASRASSSTSTGTRTRSARSPSCPPPRRTAARSRSTRTCSSRSSTSSACTASTSAPNARVALDRLRTEHDAAIGSVRRSRAADGAALACEDRLGGELRPFQRAGVALRAVVAAAVHRRRAGPGQDRRGARRCSRRTTRSRRWSICPASLKLNWQREIEHWLPHRSLHVVVGTGKVIPKADITVLNYEIVHAHRERLSPVAPAGAHPRRVALRQEPGGQAHARGPAAGRERCPRARCSSR